MSAERIDHVAEAALILENYAPDYTVALAHATLALVEQQRIANLIAYCEIPESTAITPDFKRNLHLHTIRQALGLS